MLIIKKKKKGFYNQKKIKIWQIPRKLKNAIKKLLVSLSLVKSLPEFFKSHSKLYFYIFQATLIPKFPKKKQVVNRNKYPWGPRIILITQAFIYHSRVALKLEKNSPGPTFWLFVAEACRCGKHKAVVICIQ